MARRLDAEAITNKIISVDLIDGHPDNYNQHPDEQISQLAASHESFGQYRSVVVWARPGGRYVQVAGHGYLQAAKGEGQSLVRADVLPENTSAETIKAIMVADNLHAQNSSPDDEILVRLLQEQQDAGFDLASLGTDDETLKEMLSALGDGYLSGDGGEGEDDFEAEPDEEQTRVQVGDVWQLGRHTIACLSATDPATYEKLTKGKTVQCVWSDPPYGISIVAGKGDVEGGTAHKQRLGTVNGAKPFGSKKGSIGGANPPGSRNNLRIAPTIETGKYAPVIGDDTITTAVESFDLCFQSFPSALHIWWGANYYAHALPPSKCWIVWDKENTGNFADAELAWCSDDSAVRIFKHMWNGLLKDSEQGQRRVHPTQKPCALFCWAAEKYGEPGDIIFDPFLGSGISVIGAEMLNDGRAVIGCELSPEYIDIIITRWESHTGQAAQLIERIEEAVNA